MQRIENEQLRAPKILVRREWELVSRKTLYITKNTPNWHNHPIIGKLKNHHLTTIPPPPAENNNPQEWIKALAELAKIANKQARKITTKYTQACIRKAITKYRQLNDKSPKKINKKVFKYQETPALDCILDRYNNLLTNREDIANEIHIQQSSSNRPIVSTCYYQPQHPIKCTCGVKQYPWDDIDGFVKKNNNIEIVAT